MGVGAVIFLNPSIVLVGVAVLAVTALGLGRHALRRRRLAQFLGGARAARRLSGTDLYRLRLERILLLGIAAVAVACAAANPEWVVDPAPSPPVRSVVLAIDMSASMQAADGSPTRLARALEVAQASIERLENAHVGLILFAGSPYSLAPPTRDHEVLRYFLTALSPTMASAHDPGSLLAVGIREAAAAAPIVQEPDAELSVILIGDGETSEAEATLVAEAEAALARGIRVHTVGVGTLEGSAMVMPQATYQFGGPVVGEDGAPAISRMNEPLLQRVADAGGGRYADARDPGALEELYESFETQAAAPFWARYEPALLFILVALSSLLIESLLDVRLPRRAVAADRGIA